MTLLVRLATLALLCLPASVQAVTEFTAEYSGRRDGLPFTVKGRREVRQEADGSYTLSFSAKAMMVSIKEVSRFRLMEGKLIADSYDYKRTGIGKNRYRYNKFDWPANTVRFEGGSQPLAPGILDKLLYQLQLRLDVKAAVQAGELGKLFTYQLADNENLKTYSFRIAGEETLATRLGDMATYRLERVRKNTKRHTTLWLAPRYDFLLARLQQVNEKGKGFTVELTAVKFAAEQ